MRYQFVFLIVFSIFISHLAFTNPFSAPLVLVHSKKQKNQSQNSLAGKQSAKRGAQKSNLQLQYKGFGEFNGKFYAQIEYDNTIYFVKKGSKIQKYVVLNIDKETVHLKMNDQRFTIKLNTQ